jgi:hypothetical protein
MINVRLCLLSGAVPWLELIAMLCSFSNLVPCASSLASSCVVDEDLRSKMLMYNNEGTVNYHDRTVDHRLVDEIV